MDLYEEIGLTRVINASGSMTRLGGSLMAPEVVDAMGRAARSFVRMPELLDWAGRQIAALTGAEAGLVTTGAAGGMLLSAAACMTGQDRSRMRRLPDTTGMRHEVVVQKLHRLHFDQAVRTTGARLVEVGDAEGTDPWEVEAAIGPVTAAVLHVILDPQPTVPLERVVELAHARSVPVILDAAAEALPVSHLQDFVRLGVDLVVFSGGKELGGPGDTGILCGRADLVQAAAMQAAPNYGIGRPLKVSKEQVVGLVWALRRFASLDHAACMRRWHEMVQALCGRLQGIADVCAEAAYATAGARRLCIPRVRLSLAEAGAHSVAQVVACLEAGQPSVAVYAEPQQRHIWLNPQHLQDEDVEVVAQRLRAALA